MTNKRPWEADFSDDERTLVECFLHGLSLLDVDDDGLAGGDDMADLDMLARLCVVLKALTARCRSVEDLLLAELVDATEDLLVTAVVPGEPDISTRWAKALANVVSNQLGAL
jgi:hypothetical protein